MAALRSKRAAVKLCSPKAWSFRQVAFVILVAAALGVLVVHLGGARRRRAERLIQELHKDFATFYSARLLSKHPATPRPVGATPRRGIVICAGGTTLLTNAYISIKVLRTALNNTLPVEIYHKGEKEASPKLRAAFAEFADLEFIDLLGIPFPDAHAAPRLFNGYAQKIFSLYSTKFDQVMLLDADSQPLKDPSQIFESASFRETGNIVWSDFWGAGENESPKEDVYTWLGLIPPWKDRGDWRSAESGQLFFDTVMHADVLEWLWFLNAHASLLYTRMLGDKDTFEMAFVLARKASMYNRVPHGPGLPLSELQTSVRRPLLRWRDESLRYLRLGMLQFDEAADPAFLHRTERTKFAKKGNGYSIELMHPAWFVPPMSIEVTSRVRELVWAMHSIPSSLADIDCSCCVLDASAKAALDRANISSAPPSSATCEAEVNGVPRLPLFPFSALGPRVLESMDAAFRAYDEFRRLTAS